MRLIELFESKAKPNKKVVKAPAPRNFVAKHAKTSGAGSHTDKKYSRKEKHKSKVDESSSFQSTDDKIAILKKWAMDNYNNGADTFVEAWENSDFAEALDDNEGDVAATIDHLSRIASVYSERQADAKYHQNY